MATACLVGSTGLVGGHIYTLLSKQSQFNTIYAYSRKDLPISEKVRPLTSKDTASWPQQYPSGADIFFSGLGTTRAAAGGFNNQWKIDHDLNLELAKAAKAAGTKNYVLISSTGANASGFGYMKMKGSLEEEVKKLDFDHVVILRPGLLVGNRSESRLPELMLRKIAGAISAVGGPRLTDMWAQNADVVAKAAVRAGIDAMEGKQSEKVRILTQADIVRLGRTEWKEG